MSCFVNTCKNLRRLLPADSTITFHRFPKNALMFRKWLKSLNVVDQSITWKRTMFICSEHFDPSDFNFSGPKKRLNALALPKLKKSTLTEVEAGVGEPVPSTSKDVSLPPATGSNVVEETGFFFPSLYSSPRKRRKRTISSSDTSTVSEVAERKRCRRLLSFGNVSGSNSGSTSSTKTRIITRVKMEHSYYASPRKIKQQLLEMQNKYKQVKQKEYKTTKKIKQLKKRVQSLKAVLNDGQVRKSLSTTAAEQLDSFVSAVPSALMKRMLTQCQSGVKTTRKYPDELKKFALTLHFYSAKAYDYVRKTFHMALPHPSILRKWGSSIECDPGFLLPAFDILKKKVESAEENTHKIICSLLFDEMSIKKQIEFDGMKNWGYVNIGVDLATDDCEIASEALVLMVVCQNSSWKLPIGYFLINHLNGAEKANLVVEAIKRLDAVGVYVTSVTCDGPNAHFSMFNHLGCNLKVIDDMKTFFDHPTKTEQKVYAIFDMCHMLKLIRNCLASLGVLIDKEGGEIKWEYIVQLHNVQEAEGLHLANKLGKKHIQWTRQKMKVNLAAQTLSNSTAEALQFLANDLKLPQFQGCDATIKFIQTVDKVFDLMNSRLPWAKGYKAPLKIDNEDMWRPFLLETIDYLSNLKDVKGTYLWRTPKKTAFLGLITTIKSTMAMFDYWVNYKHYMRYMLTYKMSQDHLELFFCSIRSRNGWNNNPSALQFMRSFRKLLCHIDVAGEGGNCCLLETTPLLTINSGTKKNPQIQNIDLIDIKRNNINIEMEYNYNIAQEFIELTELTENIVTYMAGYVVKMLQKTIHCTECFDLITANENDIEDRNYIYIRRRNLGPYLYPSKGVFKICCATETFIKQIMYITNNNLPSQSLIIDIISTVSKQMIGKLNNLFQSEHEEHEFKLLKDIIYCYCKIRLHNLAKKFTEKLHGELVRKKLSKLILFSHQ